MYNKIDSRSAQSTSYAELYLKLARMVSPNAYDRASSLSR